jgi:hypothetical protein
MFRTRLSLISGTVWRKPKWPDQIPGTTWEYGADIKKVRELRGLLAEQVRLHKKRKSTGLTNSRRKLIQFWTSMPWHEQVGLLFE